MEFSIDEANQIISDSKHPRYADFYHRQNPDVIAGVNKAFENANPGTSTLGAGEDLPPHINEGLNKELGINQVPEAGAQPQPAPVTTFSPEWDYTEQQAEEALKREWPYWHSENMVELQNTENFGLVFGDFLKTEADKRFLGELFQMIGHHPAGPRLYLHLIQKLKGNR